MFLFVIALIIGGIIAAVVFAASENSKQEEQNQRVLEDALNQHPEFGKYKLYRGVGTALLLSENGYYGYMLNGVFNCDKIQNLKNIKFITETFYGKQKSLGFSGQIAYQLEVIDFNDPIINLPFGIYRDNADKAVRKNAFAEVKATLDQLKKGLIINTGPAITVETESHTPIDLSALEQVCKEVGGGDDNSIDFWILSETDLDKVRTDNITPAFLNRHPPIKISYTDNEGAQTVRDIIPIRIDGSPEYGIGITAYCLLRKGERSFWANKVSSAWLQGQESNLGDYLAALCKKTSEYKEAVRAKKSTA